MNIKAKLVGKGTNLMINGMVHYLTEEDVRRLRAELNRVLERIAKKRRVKA